MHRAAETFIEAGLAGEDFSQRAVEHKIFSEIFDRFLRAVFHNLDRGAAEKLVHDFGELRIVELVNSGKALG